MLSPPRCIGGRSIWPAQVGRMGPGPPIPYEKILQDAFLGREVQEKLAFSVDFQQKWLTINKNKRCVQRRSGPPLAG